MQGFDALYNNKLKDLKTSGCVGRVHEKRTHNKTACSKTRDRKTVRAMQNGACTRPRHTLSEGRKIMIKKHMRIIKYTEKKSIKVAIIVQ